MSTSTSELLQEQYLTCPQCTNPFHQPKTLPCLHNFCKACLGSYLETEMEGGKSTTFNCPECKEKIYVPDPSKAVSRWASQFPTNFILTGMIEAIADEAGGEGQDGEKVKAAKERRGDRSDDHSPTRTDEEDVDETDSKPDASNSLQQKLSGLRDFLNEEGSELKYYLHDLDKTHKEQKNRLEMSFSRILGLIESRKIQLLEEMQQSYDEEKDRIQQATQTFKHDLDSLRSCEDLLNGMEEKGLSKGVASDMMEAIQHQVKEIDARPTKLVSRKIQFEQKLEAGRSILNLIENLGSVTITTAGEVDREAGEDGDDDRDLTLSGDAKILAKPRFLSAISRPKTSAGAKHQIYDVTVMPSGNVIMTTHGDNSVLAVKKDGDNYKNYSQLQLDSEPKCLVTISQHYVAVVGKYCIYLVGVTADKLILKQKVETGKCYTDIAAYSESSLILTCKSPPCVDFVGLNGMISETIDRDLTTNTILFKAPQFLTTSQEGVIYVSDHSSKSKPRLLGINNAGKIQFKYPGDESHELKAPHGVACDSSGHVYIVDRGAKTVVLLTPAGEKVKDLLTSKDGLTDPCTIAIDDNDILYVTNNFSEVLIFQTR